MNDSEKAMLQDPYRHISDELKSRINHDVPSTDKLFIQCICPIKGVLQAMTNLFFESIVDECRQKGITSYADYDKFLDIVRRRTARYTPTEGHGSDDSGGAKSTRTGTKKPASKRAVSQSHVRDAEGG